MISSYFRTLENNFRELFDDWTQFDEEMNRYFENFDEEFSLKTNSNEGNTKAYSLSYEYKTGMDSPKITIKGDVDENTVNKFLEGVQKRFGTHVSQLSKKQIKELPKHTDEETEIKLD